MEKEGQEEEEEEENEEENEPEKEIINIVANQEIKKIMES